MTDIRQSSPFRDSAEKSCGLFSSAKGTKKRASLYLRVSTLPNGTRTRDQTTSNQELELRNVAERMGYEIVKVYQDLGISGSKGRDKRPAFNQLIKDATKRKFDLVMAWDVSRIGRSMPDLVSFLTEVHSLGIDLYLHQQGLDTKTPSGKAMFQMAGVFAEWELGMIKERVRAGLARARAEGKKLGRPFIDEKVQRQISTALKDGISYRKCAKQFAVSLGTVQRISKLLKSSDFSALCRGTSQ